jgi:squalene cyclase
MMLKRLIKFFIGFIFHPIYVFQCITNLNKAKYSDKHKMKLAADWLLKAQINAIDGDGYSRGYSLIFGWDRSYIETTGYIIPTMFDVSYILRNKKYALSAIKAAEWLLLKQMSSGAFPDIDKNTPHIFDTGQVLLGLNRTFKETRDKKYLAAIKKACVWLTQNQEKNGSWIRYSYNNQPHTYYTRVAAALLESGQLLKNKKYINSGIKNLEWTIQQQQANGFYKFSNFKKDENAFLHTLVYVIEGFSMAYRLTKNKKWANQLISDTRNFMDILNSDGLLYSQYDSQWVATNIEYCITGLSQFAGICFDVYQISNDIKFKLCAIKILIFLDSLQQKSGKDILGALQSSKPLWGVYGGMNFFNWNVKFYIDLILKKNDPKNFYY